MFKKLFTILIFAFFVFTLLISSTSAALHKSLYVGSRGQQVTELQQTLTNLRFYSGPLTGYFGNLTREAVIRFQKTYNLYPQVGYFGPLTRNQLNKIFSSRAIQPKQITTPSSGQPAPEVPQNSAYGYLEKQNIFIVEGNSDIIYSGFGASDSGMIDMSNSVRKDNLLKKFFGQYPEAKNKYDFIFIATTFKPNDNIGEFGSFKDEIRGVGAGIDNINASNLRNYLGLTGNEKVQGYVFVMELDSIGDDLYLLLHEMSHRWLFRLGDADVCGKGFGCTRKTNYAINTNGAHYNNSVNTTTNINGQLYRDPNGGGSLEIGPVSGYCRDNSGASLYRFTSMSMYLMGLISSAEVQPLKYYETIGGWTEQGILCAEHTFGVSDVVGLVGQRNPSYPGTQKDFSVAYILLTQQGQSPTSSELSKMQFMSTNFPQRWNEATWNKSIISK